MLSDFEVFSSFAYKTMTEVLKQQIDLFNAASNNAIILRPAANIGDYTDAAHYAKISGLVRRRNAYADTAVTEKVLQQLLDTSVKVAAGTPPIRIDPGMFKWIQQDPQIAGVIIGKQMAVDTLADMLNTAIMGYVAATSGQSEVINDISAGSGAAGNVSLAALAQTAGKMGDQAQNIVAWVLHSKPLYDIYGAALANANQLFVFGNVKVATDGFGRPMVVTDSPSLVENVSGTNHYFTLGLTPGAILVDTNNDFTDNVETKNGNENIVRTYQAEWSYNLAINGYAWDKTAGGHSPADNAIASTANWDRYATSHKDLAGVMLESK
jgi:Major capsid protein 13-like